MLKPQWVADNAGGEPSGSDDAFGDDADRDASLLDAGWIGREGELKLLRRSAVIRVRIRPIESPAHRA